MPTSRLMLLPSSVRMVGGSTHPFRRHFKRSLNTMPLHRRDFVKSLTASWVVPAFASVVPSLANGATTRAAKPRKRPNQPNVIFMICDDLGYGDLGCYGSKLPTPNLEDPR